MQRPAILVDTPAAFQNMLNVFNGLDWLAVDTESNSLFAYTEQVCLMQFSTGDQDYLLDTLAGIDIHSLTKVFADPRIEIIFHAAEYDILCLKRDFGFEIANLFDTMQAARILGIEKLGLANLIADLLGVVHPKGFQKADWSRRPLTPEMRQYARMDTHYLFQLRDILHQQLADRGLLELAQEDFRRLCQVEPNHKDKQLYSQISGYHKLDGQSLAVLDELSKFRDDLAEKLKRPHFKVMGNGILLAVAQAQPRTSRELKAIEKASPKILERYKEGLLSAVKRGLSRPPLMLEKQRRPSREYCDRLEALQDWRKRAARKMKVQSDIILPRDILEQIAANRPRSMADLEALMKSIPWRFSHFGREIFMVVVKGKF